MLLLTSCFGRPEGVPLEEDLQLSAQIAELRETGGTRPLIELVPGTWDAVYMARDPVSREDIEQAVGQSIDMPSRITFGNVLVFLDGDTVVRAVRIRPVQIHPGTRLVVKYTSAVRLVAVRPHATQTYAAEPGQPVPGVP
ncbi:MAG: hypothetical protein ACRDSN_11390 [Pseudonocardiaceae bacterium]